jgi:alcohol dehydrogenase
VLQAHGAEVHQYGHHKEKLRIAAAAGIDARLARKLPAAEYGWVVDSTGSSEGLRQAVRMTKPRGTVVMKSTVHGLVGIDSAPVIVNEITLVGSRCGRFEPAIRLLKSGRVRVDQLISEVLPLNCAPLAFQRAAAPGVLKVLLEAEH